MSYYDLLLDPINTIFAVNCQLMPQSLRVGAIYIEPLLTSTVVTLSDGDVTITVDLPPELLNQMRPKFAWQTELHLHVDPS